MNAVSAGDEAKVTEIMEVYLGEEYVAKEILHSTHFTFLKEGTTEPTLGHPGSLYVIEGNKYGYVPEAQVGSWAEQQGLDWPERWRSEIPTHPWNGSSMIDFQSGPISLEQLPPDLQGPAGNLISDTNPDFPLSVENAVWALAGPEGSVPQVAGPGGEGADIVFIRDGEVVLRREVKSIVGSAQGTFNREISHAAKQVEYDGEVLVQVEAGRDAQSLVRSFRGSRPSEALQKYEGVKIVIVDSSGRVLYDGPLASRFVEE